jgi:hypothetical protein
VKPQPRAGLEHQLEECRRELAEAQEHLTEALEQQPATSEVLRVISSSAANIQPVFEIIGERNLPVSEPDISCGRLVEIVCIGEAILLPCQQTKSITDSRAQNSRVCESRQVGISSKIFGQLPDTDMVAPP